MDNYLLALAVALLALAVIFVLLGLAYVQWAWNNGDFLALIGMIPVLVLAFAFAYAAHQASDDVYERTERYRVLHERELTKDQSSATLTTGTCSINAMYTCEGGTK